MFEIGDRFWEAVTAYNTTTKSGKPDLKRSTSAGAASLLYNAEKVKGRGDPAFRVGC